jgi:hypothetical protein
MNNGAIERIDVEAERIAKAVRPDQALVQRRGRGKRIVGGRDETARRGAGTRRQTRDVEPQDHAAQTRGVLRRARDRVLAEARVEHAVRTKT